MLHTCGVVVYTAALNAMSLIPSPLAGFALLPRFAKSTPPVVVVPPTPKFAPLVVPHLELLPY